jgi:hypothetical protein
VGAPTDGIESIRYFWTNARNRGELVVSTVRVVSTIKAFGERRNIACPPRRFFHVLPAVNTRGRWLPTARASILNVR